MRNLTSPMIMISYLLSCVTCHAAILLGNPSGTITMVEFFDYQCPHCQHMAPIVDLLIKHNPDLRVILRPIPILNELSNVETAAVLAAQQQGKAAVLNTSLLKHSLSEDAQLIDRTTSLGINIHWLYREMMTSFISKQIRNNLQLFYFTGYKSVPLFMLGKSKAKHCSALLDGETSYRSLQDIINKLKED